MMVRHDILLYCIVTKRTVLRSPVFSM